MNSNDTNNIYNDFTNNEFQTLINSKSTIIEDKKNDNNCCYCYCYSR